MRLDHIGLAVKSIAEARKFYENGLGLGSEPHMEEVAGEKVRALKVIAPPGVHIELLEPTSPDSPIAKFIEKRGEGMHHLSYAVDDIAAATRRMIEKGYSPLWEQPRPGAGGCLVNFFHPRQAHGVLTELSQPPK
ncbi:MAG: methylmalonyl-CoA epimerase [Planctomycetes bacterium]|jgi:methylmalonyl-CoA epimerase|nr:methylmalonyl-CoA epimerase [Planctomycetota bacterium]MCL4728871.1 methylmalonyl-CoA epimerase [Planctomycetota bacterium]